MNNPVLAKKNDPLKTKKNRKKFFYEVSQKVLLHNKTKTKDRDYFLGSFKKIELVRIEAEL